MNYFVALALAVGFGLPLAVLAAASAQGRAASAALEGIARQPEAAGSIQTAMIIGLGLIESLVLYSLLMFFMLQGKLPDAKAVIKGAYPKIPLEVQIDKDGNVEWKGSEGK